MEPSLIQVLIDSALNTGLNPIIIKLFVNNYIFLLLLVAYIALREYSVQSPSTFDNALIKGIDAFVRKIGSFLPIKSK